MSTGEAKDRQRAVLEVGGRLRRAPDGVLVSTAFADELDAQAELLWGVGLADLAHTVTLFEAGVIPDAVAGPLLSALLELQAGPEDFAPEAAFGDLVTNREAWLLARQAPAGWLGAGRARREATTIAFHLCVRTHLLALVEALIGLGGALTEAAERHADVLVPDYTYLQVGQPTRFGHYLSTTAFGVLRDLERARSLYARVDRSPAGCGSANGSTIPQDRLGRLADLLGFDELVRHARDAMWQADLAAEIVSVAALALITADRLAEDLIVFSTQEFGLVELDDAHARASKIMPQKKNPFALTWIRAAANRALGDWTAVASAGRMPSGQPDSRLVPYRRAPAVLRTARDAVDLLASVIRDLRVDGERGRRAIDRGFAMATDLAEVLVTEANLDFRQAHQVVARLVTALREAGADFSTLPGGALDAAAREVLGHALPPIDLQAALDPVAALARRQEPGSAGPRAMAEMLSQCRTALAAQDAWRQARQRHHDQAESGLLTRAGSLAAVPE